MKTTVARCSLVALVLQIASAANAADAAAEKAGPAAIENKLLGAWQGGPCVGDYTFNADGTFELTHFTPGDNKVSGTWSIRWDALPLTLVLKCTKSDFKKRDPTREEYEYFGKDLELKLVQLSDESFEYKYANGQQLDFKRLSAEELKARDEERKVP